MSTSDAKALVEAVCDGNLSLVHTLVEEDGGSVETADESGMRVLQHAVFRQRTDVVEYLLKKGAEVDATGHEGYTALMFAAITGNVAVTQLLLEYGADSSIRNTVQKSAPEMAAFVGQHQVSEIIRNFIPKSEIFEHTRKEGPDGELGIPDEVALELYQILLFPNISPIIIAKYLKAKPSLMKPEWAKKVVSVLGDMQRSCASDNVNELGAVKVHCISEFIQEAQRAYKDDPSLNGLLKRLIKCNAQGFQLELEKLVRSAILKFDHREFNLFVLIVKQIHQIPLGSGPPAMKIINGCVSAARAPFSDQNDCAACGLYNVEKKCTQCKAVWYCDRECQKLHWSSHKSLCAKMLEASTQERKSGAVEVNTAEVK